MEQDSRKKRPVWKIVLLVLGLGAAGGGRRPPRADQLLRRAARRGRRAAQGQGGFREGCRADAAQS